LKVHKSYWKVFQRKTDLPLVANQLELRGGVSKMVSTFDLGDGIFLIDSDALGMKGYCSSYVLSSGDAHVLVETGPRTTYKNLLDGIRDLHLDLMSFSHIMVTHIHLDHAGGVGDIAEQMANAVVVVHERGAEHLVDPTRLLESSRRVFGESMSLYGGLRPVDRGRIQPVKGGDMISFGAGRMLEVIGAPGHASHEICLFDRRILALFTGDAAGLFFNDTNEVVPTTPPPDFNLEVSIQTINALARLKPKRLLFSHFGETKQALEVLVEAKRKLRSWGDIILDTFSEKSGDEKEKLRELSSLLEIKTNVLTDRFKQEHRDHCINGYLRYYRKNGLLA
jgi:glyoxylase-like metal-dependent hydrolase (beta-lactamase superfamily II)